MALKGYSTFPKAPAILEPQLQIVLCYIQDTRCGGGALTPLQRCSWWILKPQPIELFGLVWVLWHLNLLWVISYQILFMYMYQIYMDCKCIICSLIFLDKPELTCTFSFLSRGTLTCDIREHWTAVLILFGLISSVYCDRTSDHRMQSRNSTTEPPTHIAKENVYLYPCPWGYNNYADAYFQSSYEDVALEVTVSSVKSTDVTCKRNSG